MSALAEEDDLEAERCTRTTDGHDEEERVGEFMGGGGSDGIEGRQFLSVLARGGRREVAL